MAKETIHNKVLALDITTLQAEINALRIKHSLTSIAFTSQVSQTSKVQSIGVYELKNGIKSLESSRYIGVGGVNVTNITSIDVGNFVTALSLNNIEDVITTISAICANNTADYGSNHSSDYSSHHSSDYQGNCPSNYSANHSSDYSSNCSSNHSSDYECNNWSNAAANYWTNCNHTGNSAVSTI